MNQPDQQAPIGWIDAGAWAKRKGVTVDTVRKRLSSGKWLSGHHVVKRYGRNYVHWERTEQWVESGE